MIDRAATVFVAGHRGMVGSALLRELAVRGHTRVLTRTRAERRSGDICTSVMLANPIRGSFRSRWMICMISSRTWAPT